MTLSFLHEQGIGAGNPRLRTAQWYACRICLWAALLAGAVSTGCASPSGVVWLGRHTRLLGPIGEPTPASRPATQPATQISGYDDSAWQALLLEHVAVGWPTRPQEGTQQIDEPPCPSLVEYRAILEHPRDLNAYLAVLAKTGPASTPQTFPTAAHRLAYYINAYNACAVRAALAEYPAESVYVPLAPAFELDWYFQVDGRRVNLDGLRQSLSQAAGGDVRSLFGLCEAAVGSPPLASRPYKAEDLYEQLDAQTKLCLAMPQFVQVSHDREQLQLWWRVLRNRAAFGAWYEKIYGSPPASLLNAVMELSEARQRQELNKAVGYRIVEVPFDRRLNDLVVRAIAAAPQNEQ